MKEFLDQLALLFNGFPPVLLVALAPICGSLAASIIAAFMGGTEADTPKKILGQFIVGWLAGAFCGPIAARVINAPPYTLGFISGASGYWGMRWYIKKKQDELLNKPPGAAPQP